MTDIQDKYRERWQDRRSKNYNWRKLVIMALALVALIILISELNKLEPRPPKPAATTSDSVSTPFQPESGDSLQPGGAK